MKFFAVFALFVVIRAHPIPDVDEVDPEYLNPWGDILGTVDEEVDPLNAIVNQKLCWPGGVLPYEISSEYNSSQLALIEAGINDLVNSTKVNGTECISIVPRTTESDYVSVFKGSGCSSYIGRQSSSQPMSLADRCVPRHGTIMHEFLHAYGFYHEQSRSDRDDWVIVNWDNIMSGFERNFRKYDVNSIDLLDTEYDYGSVMHYGPYGFAIDKEIPTLIPLVDEAIDIIGQRLKLSEMDIERVQVLYGCMAAEDSVHFKHLADQKLNLCA